MAFWHQDDGWGAMEVPGRPTLGFVHFSRIEDVPGYRDLIGGEAREVEWADDSAETAANVGCPPRGKNSGCETSMEHER